MKWFAPALIAALIGIALAAWLWFRPPALHGTLLQEPTRPADFVFTTGDARDMRLSDLQGKWSLLYFGYTFCPDVCPTTMADLRQMRQVLGSRAGDVQVAMITLDPARDTPQHLAEYLSHFDPTFVGLTGEPAVIEAAASQFGVFFESRAVEGASKYLIDHTSIVSVLDPAGNLRYVFPYGVGGKEMAQDMRWLMRQDAASP